MTAVDDILAGLDLSAVTQADEAQTSYGLPGEFWKARPTLGLIRRAAHSRMLSADAVLHSVLSRVAGVSNHMVKLPPIVGAHAPLSYYVVIPGPSGEGKSSAYRTSTEIVPAGDGVADQLPIGSGEGLVEALFDLVEEKDPVTDKTVKVKRQTRFNCTVYVDEGQTLTAIGGRNGSTTLSTLRSGWTGGPLGQANASTERKRIVPAGAYTYGLVVAIQPELAGPLLEDTAAGTPQRFAWASSSDPTIPDEPPDWPDLVWQPPDIATLAQHRTKVGEYNTRLVDIDPAIIAEVRAQHLARRRGEGGTDPYEGHRHLLQLKVATLLALLCDRTITVTPEHWALAGVVVDSSDQVRRHVQQVVATEAATRERATSNRLANRQVQATEAVEGWRTVEAVKRLQTKVNTKPGITVREAQQGMRRWRDVFHEALDHTLADGSIVERTEPTPTGNSRCLYPGGDR